MLKKYVKFFIKNTIFEPVFTGLYRKLRREPPAITPLIPFLKAHFGKHPINVLEIGARFGDSSKLILNKFDVARYVIIDPYESYDEYNEAGFNKQLKGGQGDVIYEKVKQRLEKLSSNVKFIRKYSNDPNIMSELNGLRFDIIYIDGNHLYEYVLEDLETFYPLVSENGVLCGDDFHSRSVANDWLKTTSPATSEKMVYEAVTDFAKKHKISYLQYGNHLGYPTSFAFVKLSTGTAN